jgi:hypothetical protein
VNTWKRPSTPPIKPHKKNRLGALLLLGLGVGLAILLEHLPLLILLAVTVLVLRRGGGKWEVLALATSMPLLYLTAGLTVGNPEKKAK